MASRKQTNDAAGSSRANRTSNSKDDTSNEPNGDDQLFEPSLDMMVNDFDDETTLEMEEQLASSESHDPNAELNSLQMEGDMPIEELLALYNCVTPTHKSPSGSRKRSSRTSRNAALDKTLMPPPDAPKTPPEKVDLDDTEPVAKKLRPDSETTNIKTEEKDDNEQNGDTVLPKDGDNVEMEGIATVSGVKVKAETLDESDITENKETEKGSTSSASESDLTAGPSVKKETDDQEADAPEEDEENEGDEEEESELKKLYPETYKTKERRLLRANSHPNTDDEEEDDNDYSPEDDDYKKKIMVGSEYQAQIPEGLCQYDDALPYENEDKLLWDPTRLDQCDIELYLQRANLPALVGSPAGSPTSSLTASPTSQSSMNSFRNLSLLPCGSHLRDDEQSLFLLLQCGHNTEEALRRRRLTATLPTVMAVAVANQADQSTGSDNRMSLWSEEECRNFESGLRVYGKDFHAIQQSKVRTRSVSELVQFYYLWKKTERHDIFANKARLEKKKYNLHPGLTDYMDRFLEEQENNGGININSTSSSAMHGNSNGNEHTNRDRSLSPVMNCLLYADSKRQRMAHEHE